MNALSDSYINAFTTLKDKIRQSRAILTANVQLLAIYWEIGKFIVALKAQKEWGSKIIEQLSADLRNEFPEIK